MLAFMVGLALFIALSIMLGAGPTDAITVVLVPIGIVFVVSMSVAIAGIGVRRLHDRGKTGYWLLLYNAMPSWMMKNAGLDAAGFMGLASTFFGAPTPRRACLGMIAIGVLKSTHENTHRLRLCACDQPWAARGLRQS